MARATNSVRAELVWALRALGPSAELVRARRMYDNGHVVLHKLEIDHRGVRRRLVLRRYVDSEWVRREPDLAAREAKTLLLLESLTGLPTAKLVAVDPDGRDAGVPTVLMSHLGGRAEWCPPSIERLAAVAPIIHHVRAPRGFRRYGRYYTGSALKVPAWSTQPRLWERAFAVAEAARVDETRTTFIHRDHHAGNVLWSYGRVNGVIDWEPACIGPSAVDFAHVRLNLAAQMGIAAARRYARCADIAVDPVWDIVDACDIGSDHLPGPHARRGREAFVADALSELG
jgi:aminoglycoside phosphotransferase (APT) family kinase protein